MPLAAVEIQWELTRGAGAVKVGRLFSQLDSRLLTARAPLPPGTLGVEHGLSTEHFEHGEHECSTVLNTGPH